MEVEIEFPIIKRHRVSYSHSTPKTNYEMTDNLVHWALGRIWAIRSIDTALTIFLDLLTIPSTTTHNQFGLISMQIK